MEMAAKAAPNLKVESIKTKGSKVKKMQGSKMEDSKDVTVVKSTECPMKSYLSVFQVWNFVGFLSGCELL